jgi:hypothetical protein
MNSDLTLTKTIIQGKSLIDYKLMDETDLKWFITTVAKTTSYSSKWEDFFKPLHKSDLEHLIEIWSLPKLTELVNHFSNPCLLNSFYDLFFFYPKSQILNYPTNTLNVNQQFLSFVKADIQSKSAWEWLADVLIKDYTNVENSLYSMKYNSFVNPIFRKVFIDKLGNSHPVVELLNRNQTTIEDVAFNERRWLTSTLYFATAMDLDIYSDFADEEIEEILKLALRQKNEIGWLIVIKDFSFDYGLTNQNVVKKQSEFIDHIKRLTENVNSI